MCCRAPAATDSSTCARSASANRGCGERADLRGRVGGVADAQRGRVFSITACSNASATGSTTMRRLALMQAWPAFVNRDATAPAAACSMSASSSTTKGSEPPSSRTEVFSSRPAIAATLDPARSEPVSVTPRTRGSASICSDRVDVAEHRLERPLGEARLGEQLGDGARSPARWARA